MLQYLLTWVMWAGVGATGNLLVVLAITEMADQDDRSRQPPRGSRFAPLPTLT